MILVDSSVWIDHFRSAEAELGRLLARGDVVMHPCIAAELALGSLKRRAQTLALLDVLPKVQIATLREVRQLIEVRGLYGKGVGLTDVHLIASTLITPATKLWTRDKRLRAIAEDLGIHVNLS